MISLCFCTLFHFPFTCHRSNPKRSKAFFEVLLLLLILTQPLRDIFLMQTRRKQLLTFLSWLTDCGLWCLTEDLNQKCGASYKNVLLHSWSVILTIFSNFLGVDDEVVGICLRRIIGCKKQEKVYFIKCGS